VIAVADIRPTACSLLLQPASVAVAQWMRLGSILATLS
jgi:hypothetical protein